MLANSGENIQTRFYPADLVTRMGDQEIRQPSQIIRESWHACYYPCEALSLSFLCFCFHISEHLQLQTERIIIES